MFATPTVILALILAEQRDPVYIAWSFETPLLWTAELVDHGRPVRVTSVVPMDVDPLWAELVEWAEQNAPPVIGSDINQCVALAVATCKWGVESVTFTVGADSSTCKFTCFKMPDGPPPVENPPSKAVD